MDSTLSADRGTATHLGQAVSRGYAAGDMIPRMPRIGLRCQVPRSIALRASVAVVPWLVPLEYYAWKCVSEFLRFEIGRKFDTHRPAYVESFEEWELTEPL